MFKKYSLILSLRVSQRKCRFTNEEETLIWNPVYSFGLCRMECRMRFSLKYCGCYPHFYRDRGRYCKQKKLLTGVASLKHGTTDFICLSFHDLIHSFVRLNTKTAIQSNCLQINVDGNIQYVVLRD